jgi:fucose 4-O-acetylase-like acetyltransferase
MVKRLNFADMVKGVAILLVVFYHLLAPCFVKTFTIKVIDAVLVAFFFYSGYFYKAGKRTYKENMIARVKSLLVPFFKYSMIFWIIGSIYLLASNQETILDALCCLRNFFAGCIWNRTIQNIFAWDYHSLGKRYAYLADFWFLLSMFFASAIFFPIADRVAGDKKKGILSIIGLYLLSALCLQFKIDLPYNMQIVPFWAATMLCGTLANQEKIFECGGADKKTKWIISLATLCLGILVSYWKTPSVNIFRGTFGENEVLSMALCILSSALIIFGFSLFCILYEEAGAHNTEAVWLGSHSLTVYIYHVFFAWALCTIFGFSMQYEEVVDVATLLRSILLTIGSLALCIAAYFVEEKLENKEE